MSDPMWFRRDDADKLCEQCGTLEHAPSHEHMHRVWLEFEVAKYRRELGIAEDGPHLHVEPRRSSRPIDPLRFMP